MKDVKILLNSHAHYDHCGGLAELKKHIRCAHDRKRARRSRAQYRPRAVRAVSGGARRSRNRRQATVQLGGVTLTAHVTPGHTKGCTTWTMPVSDRGKTYQVVFYCSTSVVDKLVNNAAYPNIVSDYERSFAELRKMPCDIFLAPHAGFFKSGRKAQAAGRRQAGRVRRSHGNAEVRGRVRAIVSQAVGPATAPVTRRSNRRLRASRKRVSKSLQRHYWHRKAALPEPPLRALSDPFACWAFPSGSTSPSFCCSSVLVVHRPQQQPVARQLHTVRAGGDRIGSAA